jgi:hypothetical protein
MWTEKPDPGAGPYRAGAADAAGHPGRATHYYVRAGTSSLDAALDSASGAVISLFRTTAGRPSTFRGETGP